MLQDSSIIIRIQNFLKDIHPFGFLPVQELQQLSTHTNVSVHKNASSIFRQGDNPHEYFYIVKKGAVDIVEETEGTQVLVDKCGEGDMFGIRPLLAESTYLYTAISSEDTILYEVPLAEFKEMYRQSDKAIDYMVKRFAAGTSIRDTHERSTHAYGKLLTTTLPIRPQTNRTLVTIAADSTLGKAVETMDAHGVSSIIIVSSEGHPLGIITDRDIRRQVARHYDEAVLVTEVMSHPVKTISSQMLLQEVQLTMIESGLHHLCVTEDGTANSKGIGMITEHDILYANASDPVVILKKIKSAESTAQLKECRQKLDALLPSFLNDNLNKRITLSLIDKLNSALIQRTVKVCLQQHNARHTPIDEETFCYYSMGSAARGEQLLMTDQDNGMLLQDEVEGRRDDYLQLAAQISDTLHEIGYEYCPANMMASNPDWCKTLSEMKELSRKWILSPGPKEVLLTAIFFDFRAEYGNLSLADELRSTIQQLLESQDQYIRFLAKQAVSNPPPLSFFRKFIIEKDGQHKDMFDIKLRGIAPLSDCARVLALDACYIAKSSTLDRYESMKSEDPANAILYEDAQEAYLDLLAFRLQFALTHADSGRYIDIAELEKIHRIHLRRAFVPTRQLLDMLERKYRLAYL